MSLSVPAVGIIANPVSARDIRRIVAHAGNMQITDRANIVLRLLAGLGAESRRDLKPVLLNLFADSELVSRRMVDDLLKYKRIDGVQEALSSLAAALFPGGRQSAQLAAEIDASGLDTLVIWGGADAVIPAAHAQALHSASVEIIEGAGHMVQMEKASAVNTLILAHIG